MQSNSLSTPRSGFFQPFRKTPQRTQNITRKAITSILSPRRSAKKASNAPKFESIASSPCGPESSCCSVSPAAILQAVIPLLSSQELDHNQKGIQVLSSLIKPAKTVASQGTKICEVILTNKHDSKAKKIRTLLLSFLSNDVDFEATPEIGDDDSLVSALSEISLSEASTWDDDIDDYEDDPDHPLGRQWGALHAPSLKILADCMEELTRNESKAVSKIDYGSEFWKNFVQVLSRNIESSDRAEMCYLSLKCLRLLSSLDGSAIIPVIRYTLLPFIMNLEEVGVGSEHYPNVKMEAGHVLKLALGTSSIIP